MRKKYPSWKTRAADEVGGAVIFFLVILLLALVLFVLGELFLGE